MSPVHSICFLSCIKNLGFTYVNFLEFNCTPNWYEIHIRSQESAVMKCTARELLISANNRHLDYLIIIKRPFISMLKRRC